MNALRTMLRRITNLGLLLSLITSISACSSTNWKEEVLLHDGSKIIVKRSVERGGRHEIGQRPGATNETLTFNMPGTNQTITWDDKYSEDIGSSNFNLMMLEIHNGMPYLAASPMGCLSYNKWGRPNPPYVIFKYQSAEWHRIPLQELPAELKVPNLVISSPDNVAADKSSHGLVSAEIVKQENEGFSQPEYRTILREPIAGGGQGRCEPMVHYKCGWFGTNPDGTFNKEFADRMCNK